MLCANGQHHTEYVTCFVDVRRSRVLDVVRGRNADDVAFLSTLPLFPTWSFTLFPTGLRDSFYSMAAPFTRRRVASSSSS
jgi:hypothetical protein